MQGGRHEGGQRGTGRAAVLGPRVSRRPRARRRRTHGAGGRSFDHKTAAAAVAATTTDVGRTADRLPTVGEKPQTPINALTTHTYYDRTNNEAFVRKKKKKYYIFI